MIHEGDNLIFTNFKSRFLVEDYHQKHVTSPRHCKAFQAIVPTLLQMMIECPQWHHITLDYFSMTVNLFSLNSCSEKIRKSVVDSHLPCKDTNVSILY